MLYFVLLVCVVLQFYLGEEDLTWIDVSAILALFCVLYTLAQAFGYTSFNKLVPNVHSEKEDLMGDGDGLLVDLAKECKRKCKNYNMNFYTFKES